MKIEFKLIEGGSGADIWTRQLCGILKKKGIETSLRMFPHRYQYCPQALRAACRPSGVDIVHTNSWNGFAFKSDCPMVTTEHLVVHDVSFARYKSFGQRVFHRGFLSPFEKKTFALADAAVCVSKFTQQQVKDIFGVTAWCIPNGVDPEQFYPRETSVDVFDKTRGKIILFYAGNMTRRKGVDLLSPIMRALGDRFVLFCATGLRGAKQSLSDNIIPLGRMDHEQLAALYSRCDIFLFPTRMEGLSLTVLEAMACGAPVVTTDCCSMPELIVNGKGGFLCQQDSVGDFAAKIKELTENISLRKQMGNFNRARVEQLFTLDKMAEGYLEIYRSLAR